MLTATCEVATIIITPFCRKINWSTKRGGECSWQGRARVPPGQFGPWVHTLSPCVILSRARWAPRAILLKERQVLGTILGTSSFLFFKSNMQTDPFPWALMKLPAGISGVGRMTGKTTQQAGEESCFGLKDWHFNKLLLINSTLKFWVACSPS